MVNVRLSISNLVPPYRYLGLSVRTLFFAPCAFSSVRYALIAYQIRSCMKGNPKKSHLYHTTIWRGPQAGWCLRANPGGAQFPLHAYNPTKGQASCQILDNSSVPQIPRHLRTLISHPGPFLFHHSRDGHYRLRSL